jgi:uncharacterized membrane protein
LANLQNTEHARETRRILLLDIARGVAMVGVVLYHFAFDLRLLDFIATDVTVHPGWVIVARILSASFLFLAGANLVQAHQYKVRWPAFWRRVGVVGGAALGISLITYIAYPNMFVFFGILHAIALFSVFALPFLRLPICLIIAVALVILVAPFFFEDVLFNARLFSWIGFWVVPPATGDLVPVFPSFGIVLAGVAVARLCLNTQFYIWLAGWHPSDHLSNALKWVGQKSLIIYRLHQPVLLGVLYVVATFVQPGVHSRAELFYGTCFSSCLEVNPSAAQCKAYCQCSVAQVEIHDLWDILDAAEPSADRNQAVNQVTQACTGAE